MFSFLAVNIFITSILIVILKKDLGFLTLKRFRTFGEFLFLGTALRDYSHIILIKKIEIQNFKELRNSKPLKITSGGKNICQYILTYSSDILFFLNFNWKFNTYLILLNYLHGNVLQHV